MSFFKKIFGSKQKNPMMETIIGFIEVEDKVNYIQQHPELLTPAAIQHLDLMLEAAIAAGNETNADVLRAVRNDLIFLTLERLSLDFSLLDWPERKAYLEQHPQLLTSEADAMLETIIENLQNEGKQEAAEVWTFFRHFLARCRREGIETVFIELSPVPEHQEMVRLMRQATELYQQDHVEQALSITQQALTLGRQSLDKNHPYLALLLGNLAVTYKASGDYEQAEPFYHQSLEIYRIALGENHPAFAIGLDNLGVLYRHMGNYAQAESLHRQALEISRRTLGEQHPDLALNLLNLARLYTKTGNYVEAEPLLHQALEIQRTALGEDHPEFVDGLGLLAELYYAQGNYEQAESLRSRLIEMQQPILDEIQPGEAPFADSSQPEQTMILSDLIPAAVKLEDKNNYVYPLLNFSRLDWADKEAFLQQYPQLLTSEAEALFSLIIEQVQGEANPGIVRLWAFYRDLLARCRLEGAEVIFFKLNQAPEHQEMIQLRNEADELSQQGHYAQALVLAYQALDLGRQSLHENHLYLAGLLDTVAGLHRSMGNYGQAEPPLRRALTITQIALGEQHPRVASSLNNLAALYQEKGDYAQAEPLLQQAINIKRVTLGEDHPDFALGLNNLAVVYQAMGDYARSEPLARRATEIWRATIGEKHPDFASSLNNLAVLYQAMGNYAQAEQCYQQALEIDRNVLGETHPSFAKSLKNLAGLYQEKGDYAQAEPLLQQVIAIERVVLGEDHPDFATSLHNLAVLYRLMGKYSQAEQQFHRSLKISQTVLGENHPGFATNLDNLGLLYKMMGDYTQAERVYHQALDIRRATIGEEHPDFAGNLNNLAVLYQEMGNYAQAEPLFRQALQVWRTTLGEDHQLFATSLSNLATLYEMIGDYDAAKRLYHQALEIDRKVLGEEHPNLAKDLNNLADLHMTIGDYAQVEQLYHQALDIRRAALGEEHPDFAHSLNKLAFLYMARGDYLQAQSLYHQALKIVYNALGEKHPDFAHNLNSLAILHQLRGDYAQAEPLYRQTLDIRRAALGEKHPDVATSFKDLARVCAAIERPDEAMTLITQAVQINDQLIGQIFSFGSESQRMAYLNSIRGEAALFLSLIFYFLADQPEATQAGLDFLLRRKALSAEGLAVQRDAILSGRYPKLEPQLRQLAILRQQIADKTLAGPGPEGLDSHQQQLAAWRDQQKTVEAALARQIPEMNLTQKLRVANRQAIAKVLPPETVLIEFVHFEFVNFKATLNREDAESHPARYLAFVLVAGEPDNVSMFDLGEAGPIEQMITSYRTSITREEEHRGLYYGDEAEPDKGTELELGQAIRAAIFDPLLPALSNCRRIFLSPDGDLTRLPFEILPTVDGQRLIDRYNFSYLAAGRDILRFGAAFSGNPGQPVVIADPDFDLSGDQHALSPAEGEHGAVGRRRSQDMKRMELHFDRLPGTRREGEQIARMLQAVTFFDTEALETNLKSHPSPRILHIATHGFFLPDQKRDHHNDQAALMSSGGGAVSPGLGRLAHGLENPLLRSGLALAGANTWLRNGSLPTEAEDALFNGEDVTALDLLATELVVLSACETGLGEVQVGEGVFGLRRAFVLAGAKTLVMSLWKVPDQQTQELMIDFYRRILAGEPRAEALRQAQLALKEKYPNPLYWGAFICQGDPGPLEKIK